VAHPVSYSIGSRLFFTGVEINIHLYLVLRINKCGALSPSPQVSRA
jgi:hypothetical protein